MKLHLPVVLRKALLACFSTALAFSMSSGSSFAEDLSLGSSDSLIIDYADSTSIPCLNNGELQLDGDTVLSLLNAGQGDGKTYTLLTGVAGLVDAEGNAITLDSSNNAISNYFDITQSGIGFWSSGILQLVDGKLQVMLHGESVITSAASDGVTSITTHLSSGKKYQYYKGITFNNITTYSTYYGGGAIYGSYDAVTLSYNGSIAFSGNSAGSSGGAIHGGYNTLTLRNNGSVAFCGNSAGSSGGAICVNYDRAAMLNGNGSVEFRENTSSNMGGAIYSGSDSVITLCNNKNVVFEGNTASSTGGALYGGYHCLVTLSNNECVMFSENSTYDKGGAIYVYGTLNIQNNDSVIFEKNAEIENGTYRLRSIYAGGSGDVISLSAAEENSIEFRDSIYIISGSTMKLNADYTDDYGVVHKQTGDIIFTGAYTETHLNELLKDAGAGRVATTSEILNSRVSEVLTMTNLYGGRLCVADGAVYVGCGITAHEGSDATVRVKDAVLCHSGYDLTFHSGTTFELAGFNSITGSVLMKNGSWLVFDGSETTGMTVLTGDLTFFDGVNISLSGYSGNEQNEILMRVQGSLSGWDETTLTILNGEHNNTNNLRWIEGIGLVLNYNEETFELSCVGDMFVKSRQIFQSQAEFKHYNSLTFYNVASEDSGGAIYGEDIVLNNNSSVIFNENEIQFSTYLDYPDGNKWERYFSGGAIYGNGVVELSGNDNVIISGNEASCSIDTYHTYVDVLVESEGGGIFADDRSSISSNEKVSFSNNHAKVRVDVASRLYYDYTQQAYARGGALSSSDIVFFKNGDIEFSENSASAKLYDYDYYEDDVPVDYEGASGYAQGGATYGNNIDLQGNESVTFRNNAVSAVGGSAYSRGGAIYGNNIVINNNGSVTFGENIASSQASYYAEALGGAIYGSGKLSIQNNDSVLFEKNAEITNGSYRLRSIYAGGRGAVISLSAADDKSIEFRDSIYISSGSVVKLNADYTDADGVVHKQTGDIIFTGAYTETHLNDLLEDAGAGRVATAGEILNSRTSEVYAMTNLYGGRLRVEDGAIYQGYGITAMEGSNATVRVKDATLSHRGYDLIFHDGTLLEIDGVSTVNGNVELLSGSTLNLLANSTLNMGVESCLNAENGANIALGTDATLNLEGSFEAGDAVILELSDGAAVSRGVTTICNNGGKDVVQLDAVAFASGTMQKVKDAHVVVDSSEDTSISYQLENASVENRGGGKLTMTHENNSISSVSSAGGDVEILNVDSSDRGNILKLTSLELHESAVFGAYVGDTVSADAEACVQVSGSAVFGVGTTVNADLVLMDGCVLTMDDTVRMGSDLSINGTLTLNGDLLSLIQNAEIGMHFDLFTGIDDLYLNGVLFDSIALTDNMSASTYFIGLEDVPEYERYYRLSYASETPGEGVLSAHVVFIPEPTTATLGILALAGLAARRRRRW